MEWSGIVFSYVRVFLSIHCFSTVQGPDPVSLCIWPWLPPHNLPYMFKLAQLVPHRTGSWPPPPDMFKIVYYEAQTFGKRVVCIQLKCLLVFSFICLNKLARSEYFQYLYTHSKRPFWSF